MLIPGRWSPEESDQCYDCPVGTWSGEGYSYCAQCEYGTFADKPATKPASIMYGGCPACPANTFQDQPGQAVCKPCPTGTTSPAKSGICNGTTAASPVSVTTNTVQGTPSKSFAEIYQGPARKRGAAAGAGAKGNDAKSASGRGGKHKGTPHDFSKPPISVRKHTQPVPKAPIAPSKKGPYKGRAGAGSKRGGAGKRPRFQSLSP